MYVASVIILTAMYSYFVPCILGSDVTGEDNSDRDHSSGVFPMLQKFPPIIAKLQGLKGLHIVLWELLHALTGCEKEVLL